MQTYNIPLKSRIAYTLGFLSPEQIVVPDEVCRSAFKHMLSFCEERYENWYENSKAGSFKVNDYELRKFKQIVDEFIEKEMQGKFQLNSSCNVIDLAKKIAELDEIAERSYKGTNDFVYSYFIQFLLNELTIKLIQLFPMFEKFIDEKPADKM